MIKEIEKDQMILIIMQLLRFRMVLGLVSIYLTHQKFILFFDCSVKTPDVLENLCKRDILYIYKVQLVHADNM